MKPLPRSKALTQKPELELLTYSNIPTGTSSTTLTRRCARGKCEFSPDKFLAYSSILVPGTFLLDNTVLGIAYLIGMGYVFIGIAIISDIFMEAIEEITSQTKSIEVPGTPGKPNYYVELPVWNATVANLTLMALGSSAPEILLSVIGTVQDLEAIPSKLGPSTIVGSAAFNLLVISGLSVLAVGEEPKKVYDVGVFAVTSVSSLFAYIWLYLTLKEISPDEIETFEAWLTLIFFFVLIILSYGADRFNSYLESRKKSIEEMETQEKEDALKNKKT